MTTITPVPTPPTPTDTPTVFNTRSFALLGGLPTFVSEVNTVASEINAAAAAAAASQSAAASSASASEASRLAAANIANASANFKGAWSSLTGPLNVPAAVFHNSAWWMLMANVANVTTEVPGVSANWQVIDYVTQPIAAGGTGATTAAGALKALNNGAYLRETNGGTLVSGGNYSIWTGDGAISMALPNVASTTSGDLIVVSNIHRSWAAPNNFTITCPSNVYVQTSFGAYDNTGLVFDDQRVQVCELRCTLAYGAGAWWAPAFFMS